MSIEEVSKKVFNDLVTGFEKDTAKVFNDPEDREALSGMIEEWRRLGPATLQKLSMNQPWNMPLYFTLSAAVLSRRERERESAFNIREYLLGDIIPVFI